MKLELHNKATGTLLAYKKICTVGCVFFAFMCVVEVIGLIGHLVSNSTYGWDDETSAVAIVLCVSPIFFGAFSVYCRNGLKSIEKELCARGITDQDKRNANTFIKRLFIATAVICVVMSLLLVGVLTDGDNDKGTCRNCGRRTHLVEGFGYCYNCYEGFVDWQNENWDN